MQTPPTQEEDDGSINSDAVDSSMMNESFKNQPEQAKIAGEEIGRVLNCSRFAMLFLLLASTIGVGVGVYYYTTTEETKAFENQYEEDFRKVFESVGSTFDFTLGAVDSFVVDEQSYNRDTNGSWPFVTFPDFAVRASKLRSLTKTAVVNQYPLVLEDERSQWEEYSVTNDAWVDEGIAIQKEDPLFEGTNTYGEWSGLGFIHGNDGRIPGPGPYFPTWQSSPVVPHFSPYNWDLLTYYPDDIAALLDQKLVVIGTDNLHEDGSAVEIDEQTVEWIQDFIGDDQDPTEPLMVLYFPVLDDSTLHEVRVDDVDHHSIVGIMVLTMFWTEIVKDILPPGSDGIVVVFGNGCGPEFSYQLFGPNAVYLGGGDRHDPSYDYLGKESVFTNLKDFSISPSKYSGPGIVEDYCPFHVKIYPSDEMKADYKTSNPTIFTAVAVSIFIFTSLVFFTYDHLSQTRQNRILTSATQSNAIITSLFPAAVRDRLMEDHAGPEKGTWKAAGSMETPKRRLQSFLGDDGVPSTTQIGDSSSPIAELFTDTTVMFADISGFTAWSSVRSPEMVFMLLESIYGSFDRIANRRGVFKVETIGDSYVAVCGLPKPRVDHAVVMMRFARDCREKMFALVKELEVSLGPGTGELQFRFGMNSGPVTAGVLRGERARFQLFGDTVNTAARMESTGMASKLHVSQSTAELLIAAGKSHWVVKRPDKVEAKGKGSMQTYWVEPSANGASGSQSSDGLDMASDSDGKTKRLLAWNVDILRGLIKQIVARREAAPRRKSTATSSITLPMESGAVLEEVREIIEIPEYDPTSFRKQNNPGSVILSDAVTTQLQGYVAAIASMYRDNPFHNFEHASHVCMSVVKLLSRIVAPDEVFQEQKDDCRHDGSRHIHSRLHDHTYGITSDPLTQFACVLSALIHDVDHPGVPNSQLIEENSPLAAVYHNKAIAEQNSVDLAWTLFNEESYADLRAILCETKKDMRRLRQLMVNSVMATDIMDKDLKVLRNNRWDTAFAENAKTTGRDTVNRKATIVIEHLIQASDVAHTMQHWHVYRKWNERLFEEMYAAFRAGRAAHNPVDVWYKGELGFFDFYILPLARKLRDCGVFGVSSDEYLNYAERNREEWESKGQEIVAAMVEKIVAKHGSLAD